MKNIALPVKAEKQRNGAYLLVAADSELILEAYAVTDAEMKQIVKCVNNFDKAMKALELADGIMDYCAGDKWERECTKDDREKYQALYAELKA